MNARSGAQPISRRLRLVSRRPVCGSSRQSPEDRTLQHAAWRPVPHHAARDRGRGALASSGTTQAARRSVEQGPRFRGCDREGVRETAVRCGVLARSRVAPTHDRAGTAPPSAVLLASTRRDGTIWVHFVVANPCNTRGIPAASLLELHPTSPPSHTRGFLR
jgi:hypothetical protein